MRYFFIAVLLLLHSTAGFCQQQEAADKLVKEGIALHDKEDYDGAIKKYDEALQIDKDNYNALYEKSLSCLYSKRYDECISISEFLVKKYADNPVIKEVYSNWGSAEDDKGDPEKAIKIYERGIKQFPGFYLLHFNKGLTLARIKKWDDALLCFFDALENKPTHAGSLYFSSLAQEKSNKVAALMSGLAFLAAEPEGKRAESVYNYMFELLNSFAVKDEKGNSTISIFTDDIDNKKKENNFGMVQMVMGLSVVSALTDSVKAKTDVDKLSLYIQMMANALSVNQQEGKGLYWKTYAPFFIDMKAKELVTVFAHIAAITSGNEENIQWISANQDKLKEFYTWYNSYPWSLKK